VQAPSSGAYYFRTRSDAGVRLWVNGVQVINHWTAHVAAIRTSAAVTLTAGTRYAIKVEYYDNGGQAIAQLRWRTPARRRTSRCRRAGCTRTEPSRRNPRRGACVARGPRQRGTRSLHGLLATVLLGVQASAGVVGTPAATARPPAALRSPSLALSRHESRGSELFFPVTSP
jgi:hypothetical protein